MERQGSPLTQDIEETIRGRQATSTKIGHTADLAAAMVGEKLGSAADTLRGSLPQEGRLAGAARAVTEGLESSGHYLQEQGLTGVADELESVIRRYPIQALLVGAAVGYTLSRLRMREP
ncbi:hypothetical protein [Nitrospira sp. Nam74]